MTDSDSQICYAKQRKPTSPNGSHDSWSGRGFWASSPSRKATNASSADDLVSPEGAAAAQKSLTRLVWDVEVRWNEADERAGETWTGAG